MKKLIYALALVGLMSATATAQTFDFGCTTVDDVSFIDSHLTLQHYINGVSGDAYFTLNCFVPSSSDEYLFILKQYDTDVKEDHGILYQISYTGGDVSTKPSDYKPNAGTELLYPTLEDWLAALESEFCTE